MFTKLYLSLRERLQDRKTTKQLVKFCVVGGGASLVNATLLLLLAEGFGVWYLAASVVAYIISAVFNFLMNKRWTFRNNLTGIHIAHQGVKFTIISIIGLGVNTLVIYLATERVGLHYLVSWVIATGFVAGWNFIFNRNWTFRHGSN